MSQRGFTLLEMMLVLLLIGVSASMVLLAFPSARTQEATQILARFQAQLDFVRERGQQTGQLFGIVIHPDRWQFMRLQPADEDAPAAADDRWGNAQWLPLQAGRVTTAETLPRTRLTLRFPDGQAWTPGEQPDVLIFPGGEVTPFQLRIDAATGITIDAQGDRQPAAGGAGAAMKRQAGMTLIEVMVALVIFALAGLAVMQSTLQQTRQLGRMEEKILASWLADNQLVQLRLEKRWPALSWSETTVEAAGTRWFVRWQGVETALPQLRALDVEVRRQKSDPAPLATLRTWVTPP